MDSHTCIDTVKIEKANAIARYRRFENLAQLLQILELVVALTLISWSSTCLPAVVKFAGHCFLQISLYFLNPHVVFLIGNAIVIALFILYRHRIDASDNSAASDFHDDFVEYNSTDAAESAPAKEEEMTEEEEKQIVCEQKNVVGETECEAAEKAINDAIKRIRKFERTKSERLRRDISGKQLRRIEDKIMIEYESVETLSNEEFRVAVEAFIQKQQTFLRQQKMADIH